MPAAAFADIRRFAHIAATVAAATFALSASRLPTQAQTNHMLIVPASDGYDFDDCLAGKKACGQTIADAWCEAHGMIAATSFGRADDVTASIGTAPTSIAQTSAPKVVPGSFIVNCRG